MSIFCPRSIYSSTLRDKSCFTHHVLPRIQCLRHASASSRLSAQYSKPPPRRLSSTNSQRTVKSADEALSRWRSGPFSITAAGLFIASGAAMIYYFRSEKERVERNRVAEASKGMGKPKVGGKFELLDYSGKKFGDEDMKGGFTLVYFGFSHCPDICPEELDKMARMIDIASPQSSSSSSPSSSSSSSSSSPSSTSSTPPPRLPLLPLFITCDPARDTPSVLKSYLAEFHPAILGLTGTYEQVKQVCKAYRVYFSTPEGVKPGMDYLVDHSIYFYLMDPEGDFVEAIGRQNSAEQAAKIIKAHMSDWDGSVKKT